MVDSAEQGGVWRPGQRYRTRRPGERRSVSRSATRALDVLEHFGAARRPLKAVEIAQTLGLHPSTAHQLLKTMVESAHLVFDARSKTYLPSHRLAGFSAWVVGAYGAEDNLLGLVRRLQAQTGEIVTLTTPNDLHMQIVDLAGGGPAERGLRVPIFGSAVGAAYLSTLSDPDLDRLAERARIATGELPAIRAAAAAARAAGFAEAPSPDGGAWSIAAPAPGSGFPAPLVVGLAGPAERMRRDRTSLAGLMRSAIRDLAPAAGA